MKRTALCCTTDFVDNLFNSEDHEDVRPGGARGHHLFTPEDIDALMAYCASLGATRHEWIFTTTDSLYDVEAPLGFDVLRVACEAAHRHGMRFDAVLKPFEGGGYQLRLPAAFPTPPGTPCIRDGDGVMHNLRPFVAAHPEMRLARDPADAVDPGGPVRAIRLVKRGAEGTGIHPGEITILFSRDATGARIERYEGPVVYEETVEYRPVLFPDTYTEGGCRVLSLTGLQLPEDAAYLILRCEAAGVTDFVNDYNNIGELVNPGGQLIPCAVTRGPVYPRDILRPRLEYDHYRSHPEVKAITDDPERLQTLCEQANRLRTTCPPPQSPLHQKPALQLTEGSQLVLMRGKPRHIISALNPIYPEVRAHWLDEVRFCIDRGVDGVNIRTQNHNFVVDPWAYGFNPPTRERMGHQGNRAEAARINGDAYTQFMREAADLLHAAGREMGVHVYTTMLGTDDRTAVGIACSLTPSNIEWQWKTWIREIADYVEFRGAYTMYPEHIARVVDTIGLVARDAGKRFIYQGSRAGGGPTFDGPYGHLSWEIETIVCPHPDVHEYNLYETATFTHFNGQGVLVGSPGIAELVRRLRVG